jgi:uncharacterized protein
MKVRSFLLLIITLSWSQFQFVTDASGQRPRFKVAAFYSTKGEMDHINFAKDALYFFDLIAGQQDFTFDATTDWTNLNDN